MSITSYFAPRNTKVIDNDPTPACSPLLLASSASTTTIPTMQATPLQNKDKDNKDNSCYPSHNPTNRLANMEERRNRRTGRRKTKYQRRQEKQSLHRRQPTPSSSPWWIWADTSIQSQWHWWWWWCIHGHFTNSMWQRGKWRRGRGDCSSSCCKETQGQQPLLSWLLWDLTILILLSQLSPGHNPPHQGVVTTDLQEKGNWGRVQDLWPGGCQWQPLVWCTNIHLLAWSSWQRLNARTWHVKQLHWPLQNARGHLSDHAHSQAEETTQEKINKI